MLISLLALLAPTQLAKHFWPAFAYVWGLRLDYLSPAIYLSEIVLLICLAANLKLLKKSFRPVWLVALVYAVLNSLLATNPTVALFRWLKIGELFLLAVLVSRIKINLRKQLFWPLLISSLVVALLAISQFIKGGTLGGVFYFLGERSFSKISTGIALVDVFGREYLRPYSTFSHPNSLAGYLLVVVCLCWRDLLRKKKNWFAWPPLFLAFGLTFSKGAWAAAVVLLILSWLAKINYRVFSKTVLGLAFFLLAVSLSSLLVNQSQLLTSQNSTISQRAYLVEIAKEVWSEKPLLGVGLNNFVVVIPKAAPYLQTAWLLQPVHSLALLILTEGGLLGLAMASWLFYKALARNLSYRRVALVLALIAILLTGVVDHYWLTLWQNLLLGSLVFGLTFRQRLD